MGHFFRVCLSPKNFKNLVIFFGLSGYFLGYLVIFLGYLAIFIQFSG